MQAQSTAAKVTADSSQSVSDIAFAVMAEAGAIDETTVTEHIDVFAKWQPGVSVKEGAYRTFGQNEQVELYRCLQAHTTQEGWEPTAAPALWKRAGDPNAEWPDWSQPICARDAYDAAAKVAHLGKHWISDIDNNVWEPGVYGWTEAAE